MSSTGRSPAERTVRVVFGDSDDEPWAMMYGAAVDSVSPDVLDGKLRAVSKRVEVICRDGGYRLQPKRGISMRQSDLTSLFYGLVSHMGWIVSREP